MAGPLKKKFCGFPYYLLFYIKSVVTIGNLLFSCQYFMDSLSLFFFIKHPISIHNIDLKYWLFIWLSVDNLFFVTTMCCRLIKMLAEGQIMVSDGNSKKGAHVRSNFCYLIRHLIRWIPKRNIFLYACAKLSEFPSNISNMRNNHVITQTMQGFSVSVIVFIFFFFLPCTYLYLTRQYFVSFLQYRFV